MERLEASLIDAKILTLVHDSLQQFVAPALQERLGGGRDAVYCPVTMISSVRFHRAKKARADATPTQRSFYETGGRPWRQMSMARDGLSLERSNAAYLSVQKRHDPERKALRGGERG